MGLHGQIRAIGLRTPIHSGESGQSISESKYQTIKHIGREHAAQIFQRVGQGRRRPTSTLTFFNIIFINMLYLYSSANVYYTIYCLQTLSLIK